MRMDVDGNLFIALNASGLISVRFGAGRGMGRGTAAGIAALVANALFAWNLTLPANAA